MKCNIFLALLVCLFFNGRLLSQCQANAGNTYQYSCNNSPGFDTLVLGGQPTAIGGQGPYTYVWSIKPYQATSGSRFFYASSILDDTTVANPKLISYLTDTTKFYLTVTDAQNCVSRDSTSIVISRFIFKLATFTYTINQGDSIFLQGLSGWGNIAPVNFVWRPNHGLRDSTSVSFWAKPDSSIGYYNVFTDAAECTIESGPYHYITVNSLAAQDLKPAPRWKLYPNPVTDFAQLLYPENEQILSGKLYNSLGQEMPLPHLEKGKINLSYLAAGYYIFHIETASKTEQIRFLKK